MENDVRRRRKNCDDFRESMCRIRSHLSIEGRVMTFCTSKESPEESMLKIMFCMVIQTAGESFVKELLSLPPLVPCISFTTFAWC